MINTKRAETEKIIEELANNDKEIENSKNDQESSLKLKQNTDNDHDSDTSSTNSEMDDDHNDVKLGDDDDDEEEDVDEVIKKPEETIEINQVHQEDSVNVNDE